MAGELLLQFPELKIHIVNSGDFPDSLAVRSIFHGAKSYIDSRDGPDEFRKALKKIYSGEEYYSPGIDRYFNEANEMLNLTRQVTGREWQILFLLCNGFDEDQIGYNLAISRRTVDTHINNLHKVLDAKKRIELLGRALNLGWEERTSSFSRY
jgi:DNA-binding NarL/FixJ family response regulator